MKEAQGFSNVSNVHNQNPQRITSDNRADIKLHGWEISSVQGPIANSIREEELRSHLGIKLPSMLFYESNLRIIHVHTHFELSFNAIDALKGVGEADPRIKVRAANHWMCKGERSDVELTTIEHASDWTFTTKYVGTMLRANVDSVDNLAEHCDSSDSQVTTIDYEALRDTSLQILFLSEVVLFEDELDDNGVASFRVRLRVMPTFFFVLARFFLRVDGVIIRIFDTRYFHRFGSSTVVRETTHRQGDLTTALKNIHPSVLNDADAVAPQVPITFTKLDNIRI